MVRKRSEQDILNDFQTFINDDSRLPELDLSGGNVVTDFLEAFPADLAAAYDTLQGVEEAASLQNAATIGDDGMSQLALNFFQARLEATKSSGTLTFRRNIAPTGTVTIPKGASVRTLVDEQTNTFVRFVTTVEVSMGTSTLRNSLTGFYEVDVPAIAETAGTMGNVGRNTVVFLETAITGINSVTNKFNFMGGTDQETGPALATRVLAQKVSGQTIGTRSGYKTALISAFPGLTNVEVVGPTDPAMVRNVYGGAVDIYCAESNPQPFTETILFRFGDTQSTISTRPVDLVTSVVGATTGSIFVQGPDWTFSKDTSAVYGGSVRSVDAVSWVSGGRQPGGTQTITVSGLYNKLIVDTQAYLLDPTRKVPATDLLVKEAVRRYVDVEVSVTAFGGYDKADVQTRVVQAIIDGLSSYTLGADVQQADLVDLISQVAGVDEVVIPFTQLSLQGETGVADIDLTRRELARADTPNIDVTVI